MPLLDKSCSEMSFIRVSTSIAPSLEYPKGLDCPIASISDENYMKHCPAQFSKNQDMSGIEILTSWNVGVIFIHEPFRIELPLCHITNRLVYVLFCKSEVQHINSDLLCKQLDDVLSRVIAPVLLCRRTIPRITCTISITLGSRVRNSFSLNNENR